MGRGDETRQRIVDRALELASSDGLEGLTIGRLSSDLGLSKSGLFSHFGSKEGLQVAVLEAAAVRFTDEVLRPAFRAPRGLPRLWAWLDRWIAWDQGAGRPGGCVLLAAGFEFDARPSPMREALVRHRRDLIASLVYALRLAVDVGHLDPALDPEQIAFEMIGLIHAHHHARLLLEDARAAERTRTAFERMLEPYVTAEA